MYPFFQRPFTPDRNARIVFSLLSLTAIAWTVQQVWEVVLPFVLAGIFAYALLPIVRFVQYKLHVRSRGLSVLIVFILLSSLLTLGGGYLVPSIQAEVEKTLHTLSITGGWQGLLAKIIPPETLHQLEQTVDLQHLFRNLDPDRLADTLQTLGEHISKLVNSTLSLFSWGVIFLMGIVYFLFLLSDLENLVRGGIKLFPQVHHKTLKSVLREVDYYMNSYFRGQALVALSVGVLCCFGFNIVGLPMATAMGITIGILNFIPYMQALGLPPLALLAVLMSMQTGQNIWVCLLLAFGVLCVVQIIQDGFIVPRIMGNSLGMRPSLILLTISVWGYLLGFLGVLIALPLTMSIYSVYRRFVLCDREYAEAVDRKLRQTKPFH